MLLVRGARQVVTPQGLAVSRGHQMANPRVISDGSILIDGETIYRVGSTRRIENLREARQADEIDVRGKVVLPGFVDSCTRLPFGRPVLREFMARIEGFGFSDSSGDAWDDLQTVRKNSPKALRMESRRWTRVFAAHGTTALEVHSAQGLDLTSELKGLRASLAIDGQPLDVGTTFHAGRAEALSLAGNPEAAAEEVVEVLLPLIKRRRLSRCCAVEADPHIFGAEGARNILIAARDAGFRVKVLAGRDRKDGGTRLALEMNALSAEHLNHLSNDEVDALGLSSTLATVLPAAAYQRQSRFAPARRLIDRGAALVLASGFGAGQSPTLSMPTVLSIACHQMGITPAEALSASTLNGAAAMGRSNRIGSIEPGKQADLAVFDVPDYREIPYYLGCNLCAMTIKKGRVVYRAGNVGPLPNEGPVSREPEQGPGRARVVDPLRRALRLE